MIYSFYDESTGLFTGVKFSTTNGSADHLQKQVPAGQQALSGDHDHLAQKVVAGAVVDYQPPQPSADHEWNADVKRWRLTAAAQALVTAKASAVARIAALIDSQHHVVRAHILGDATAAASLKAIDAEIAALRKDL